MPLASTLRTLLAGAALALAALPSSAAILYSSPWAGTPYGLQADVFVGPATTTVSLGGPVAIDSLSWWGTYGIAGSPADDLFTVTFNGNTLAGTVTAVDAATASVAAWLYTLTVQAPLLFGGGAVDIGIVNGAGDVELEWFWLDAGTDPGGIPTDILPSSLVIEGERQATPIPEPGTLALLAGAAGVWALLRRRRNATTTA